MAGYGKAKVAKLLADPGIIRNKLKIAAAVQNARSYLAVQTEFSSFDAYVWRFVGGGPKVNSWKQHRQVPASTSESDALSKDLKGRGFKFVGTTICYAFMQAVGMVDDHLVACFRHSPAPLKPAILLLLKCVSILCEEEHGGSSRRVGERRF